ncbi:MAG: RNA polymerase sigma-70 factor [Bacteroidetes bacterium]|nr:RNA polymerase sigma-70 factor [Bacteroidota bacterium]MCH8523993.1 RNA polymerase sigma-70 factor [Balneolales bacterium]
MASKGTEKQDESSLVLAVNNGDKEAFAQIYRVNFLSLCEFAYYMTHDAEVAKELVQDMFLAIWEQRESWSPSGSIRSYLYRATKNRSLDYLKHQKVVRKWENRSILNQIDTSEDEDLLSSQQLASAINKEVNQLPPKCRIIFLMSRQQGLTYKEIAEIQGVSVKTVETQIGRALKKLRTSLKDYL